MCISRYIAVAITRCSRASALIVVGFGAGGMTDVTSRMLGRHMEKALGVTVIIENKPGVGGTLAINSAGQLPADGHTLVSFPAEVPFTNAYHGKPFNLDEWAVLGGYMPQERVVFAVKIAPFSTFQEMVEYAKKSPVTFGDAGSFWSARVIEAYAKKHGLQIAVVSHRSGQEASMAIMGGHVMAAETGTGTPAWATARAENPGDAYARRARRIRNAKRSHFGAAGCRLHRPRVLWLCSARGHHRMTGSRSCAPHSSRQSRTLKCKSR